MKQQIEKYLTALNQGKRVTISIEPNGKWLRASAMVRGISYGFNAHKGTSTVKLLQDLKEFIKNDL